MRQQKGDGELVTKGFLRQELDGHFKQSEKKSRATWKKDIKDALRPYPTKIQVELTIESSERRSDDRMRGYRDEILTKLDAVMGELGQLREDRLFERHQLKVIHDSQ